MPKETDLQQLIATRVMEGRTVEYKLTLPGATDSEKREFLADISSFANTSGGSLYYGIREHDGLPTELVGLDLPDADAAIQRLDSLIRDGLDPRLSPPSIQKIDLSSSKAVLVITVPRSWAQPHSVKATGRFHGRNSGGKYQLDTAELRRAFLLSESLPERMRSFRRDRLALIEAGESPLTTQDRAKAVLHVMPLQAFSPGTLIDFEALEALESKVLALPLLPGYGNSSRHNFDGLLYYSVAHTSNVTIAYTQLFRNGCVEAVDTLMLSHGEDNYIPGHSFEAKIAKSFGTYVDVLRDLGVVPPIYVTLSLLNVSGYYIATGSSVDAFDGSLIDREELLFPEIVIEQFGDSAYSILRPLFDMIWNAAGWPRSLNYDEEGNWIIP